MPITAIEALSKVKSLDLVGNETKWFEKLCLYTDYKIDNFFDGEVIRIGMDNMWIAPVGDKEQINCGPHPHQIPHWRQGSVVKVWIKTYEDLGWKITPIGDNWSSYNSDYKFEIDHRDIKINEILS